MRPVRASRRPAQRGQAIPIIALSSLVIIGVAALAVDLSLDTHYRRNLQNTADAAALAGAQDLKTAGGVASERVQGAKDALALVHRQLGLSGSDTTWAASQDFSHCGGGNSQCIVSVQSGAGPFTVVVATPPLSASDASNYPHSFASGYANASSRVEYFQVDVSEVSDGGFSKAIGFLTNRESAHAVAFHTPPDQHLGFALYSKTFVQDGNAGEVITGNIYSEQYLQPQSSGQAFICAQGGSIVLGAPQVPSAGATDVQANHNPMPSSARQVTFIGTGSQCSNITGGGVIAQTNAEGCANIQNVALPAGSYVDDPAWPGQSVTTGSTLACVASPAIAVPNFGQPTVPKTAPTFDCSAGNTGLVGNQYQPGIYTCPLKVDHNLAPGVYVIEHQHGLNANKPDLEIAQSVNLSGVTFYFKNNSFQEPPTAYFHGNGTTITQSPYCPNPTSNPYDCVFPLFADTSVATIVSTADSGMTYTASGTIYLPSGTFAIGQNSRAVITGQAIVNQWDDQSGFHPDPSITYNASKAAPELEDLRLVE